MIAGYLGPSGRRCMIHAHLPAVPSDHFVLICPPVLSEHLRNYRREYRMATELAQRGALALRLHYRGQGNSDPAETTIETASEDARSVVRWATGQGYRLEAVVGVRWGAFVALATAGDSARVVLWEPPVDGSTYLRELGRARKFHQLTRQHNGVEDGDDRDVLGFMLTPSLRASTSPRALVDEVARHDTRELLILSATTTDQRAQPYRDVLEDVRSRGGSADLRPVEGPVDWLFDLPDYDLRADEHAGAAWVLPTVEHLSTGDPGAGSELDNAALSSRETSEAVEQPVLLTVDKEDVFGVLTRPRNTANGLGVVLVYGAGHKMSAHRNRVWLRLAGRAAGLGYHVLRLDHIGSGDSSGPSRPFRLDEPHVELVLAAVEHLRGLGLARQVVVGSCHGGRTALAAAAAIPSVVGVSAESLAVREMPKLNPAARSPRRPKLLTRRSPSSGYDTATVARETAAVYERGGSLQLVYGEGDDVHLAYGTAVEGPHAAHLTRPRIEVTVVPGPLHGFPNLSGQQGYLDAVTSWLDTLPDHVR